MKGITALTLANGRTLEVKGAYQDVEITLQARTLTDDDGKRRLVTTDGRQVTINIAAITLVEEVAEKAKGTFGFAQALEAAA